MFSGLPAGTACTVTAAFSLASSCASGTYSRTTVSYTINSANATSSTTMIYNQPSTYTNMNYTFAMPSTIAYFLYSVVRECDSCIGTCTSYVACTLTDLSNCYFSFLGFCSIPQAASSDTCNSGFYFCPRQADSSKFCLIISPVKAPPSAFSFFFFFFLFLFFFFLFYISPALALVAPYSGTVFQQATSITFNWTDITPSEPNCVSQTTAFEYQLQVWNASNIQTAHVVGSVRVPVFFFFFFFFFFFRHKPKKKMMTSVLVDHLRPELRLHRSPLSPPRHVLLVGPKCPSGPTC